MFFPKGCDLETVDVHGYSTSMWTELQENCDFPSHFPRGTNVGKADRFETTSGSAGTPTLHWALADVVLSTTWCENVWNTFDLPFVWPFCLATLWSFLRRIIEHPITMPLEACVNVDPMNNDGMSKLHFKGQVEMGHHNPYFDVHPT